MGPRPAAAETYAELNAAIAGGVTDNALSAPKGSDQARTGADQFALVRVGGRVFRVARSIQNDLAYAFSLSRYLDHPRANTQSHALTWTSTIALTRPTQLRLALAASYSRLASANPLIEASAGAAVGGGAIIDGPVSYIGVNFVETLTHRPTALRLGVQALSVSTFVPMSDKQVSAVVAQHLLRGEALRGRNAATADFTLGVTFNAGAEDSLGQEITPSSQFVFAQLLGGARRELSAAWSISGEAGGLTVFRLEGGPIVIGPAWRAGLRYRREFGFASLEVARNPQPNAYVGDAVVADRVTLAVGLPLDRRDRFFLGGFGSYQRGRVVDSVTFSGPFGDGFDVWGAAASLAYRPPDLPMAVSLDYSYINQEGRTASANNGALPAVERQSVMLVVTGILRDSRPRQAPVAD